MDFPTPSSPTWRSCTTSAPSLGALVIGHYSDRLGRRFAIILALIICALSIPLWAFGSTIVMLALGSFAMQFGVQGAFGVIPAHLNELSPSSVRSLFPGVVYQLGVLIAAPSVVVEFTLRRHFGYQWALTIFEMCVIFCFVPDLRIWSGTKRPRFPCVAVRLVQCD